MEEKKQESIFKNFFNVVKLIALGKVIKRVALIAVQYGFGITQTECASIMPPAMVIQCAPANTPKNNPHVES